MGSLLGSIVDYYATASTTAAGALRTALGSGQMYADLFPPKVPLKPFVVLSELSARNDYEGKSSGLRPTIRWTEVVFLVYGKGREQVETILEKLEEVYLNNNSQLSISGKTHMATYFNDRSLTYGVDGWNGTLVLNFVVSKPGTVEDCDVLE